MRSCGLSFQVLWLAHPPPFFLVHSDSARRTVKDGGTRSQNVMVVNDFAKSFMSIQNMPSSLSAWPTSLFSAGVQRGSLSCHAPVHSHCPHGFRNCTRTSPYSRRQQRVRLMSGLGGMKLLFDRLCPLSLILCLCLSFTQTHTLSHTVSGDETHHTHLARLLHLIDRVRVPSVEPITEGLFRPTIIGRRSLQESTERPVRFNGRRGYVRYPPSDVRRNLFRAISHHNRSSQRNVPVLQQFQRRFPVRPAVLHA